MAGLWQARRWAEFVGQPAATAVAGYFALHADSSSQRFLCGTASALGAVGLVLSLLGPFLVRRAARKGRLKGRHSHSPLPSSEQGAHNPADMQH